MSNSINVAAIGGGHGLANVIRAVAPFNRASVTAIVSTADNGGSSGRIRANYDICAPGDIRRCLSAAATPGSVLGTYLETRMAGGPFDDHPLGNILITQVARSCGDFSTAVQLVGEMVEARCLVLPATSEPVDLTATSLGTILFGQTAIENALLEGAPVSQLAVTPPTAPSPKLVLEALDTADHIICGPGSMYTSILAAAAVPAIGERLRQSGPKVTFVANLTHGPLSQCLSDQLATLAANRIKPARVVADSSIELDSALAVDIELLVADVAAADGSTHDPNLLGQALWELLAPTR